MPLRRGNVIKIVVNNRDSYFSQGNLAVDLNITFI